MAPTHSFKKKKTPPISSFMVKAKKLSTLLLIALFLLSLQSTEAQIGVCYGNVADNLPSEQEVVNLYKSNGIGAMRIYYPNQKALQALQGSGIKLILDVHNEKIQSLGSDPSAAMQWVQTNVVPFSSTIKYIAVGNEVHPNDQVAPSVGPAMDNILNALNSASLGYHIKVSTSIDTSLVVDSYPPSSGTFSNMQFMGPIVDFLKSNGSPLLVNVYTYFSYTGNPKNIDLRYALFTSPEPVITDRTGLQYQNLFDAIVDSVYAALSKAGAPNVPIVVSETGWPSNGGEAATVDNAETYYKNLINHVRQNGTPLKPGQGIETYLFAMFDEDKKKGSPTENNFGLFLPNEMPKYNLYFN